MSRDRGAQCAMTVSIQTMLESPATVSDLGNFTRQIFLNSGSLLQLLLEHGDLLNIDISQGSVAKHLRCGGIFEYQFLLQIYDWVCQRILKIG